MNQYPFWGVQDHPDFHPATPAQMQEMQEMITASRNPLAPENQRNFQAWRQAMLENWEVKEDVTGTNLSRETIDSYMIFLRENPNHLHQLGICESGELFMKWGNEEVILTHPEANQCTVRNENGTQIEHCPSGKIPQTLEIMKGKMEGGNTQ